MSVVEAGNCWDAISNCVLGDEEFDNILNILDFPLESLEEDGFVADWDIGKSECLGPLRPDEVSGPPAVADTNVNSGPPPHLPTGLNVAIGAEEQKPGPHLISSPGSHNDLQLNKSAEARESSISHTQSPVSVLESSGSCSAPGKNPLVVSSNPIPIRPRSSRHKRASTNPWPTPLSLFTSILQKENLKEKKSPDEAEDETEKLVHPRAPVKKCMHCQVTKTPQWREGPLGRKTLCNACGVRYRSGRLFPEYRPAASPTFEAEDETAKLVPPRAPVKKCMHCQVTKTPQWREGPLGRKTLCNACGVRYRSGRLFPEYRPAASPTFVPSLHSNSHKTVIMMRNEGKKLKVKMEEPHML
ncbi:GATA transcription factor 11 [Striga hermonthica]|uniref:GATA transcription factor 11 n=1 Tax=Striga hermonthica TaxID=68872 RepID=A0A9N7NGI5_STRHE|nr:GATA transcription factor 11 [Striga hermonthica]